MAWMMNANQKLAGFLTAAALMWAGCTQPENPSEDPAQPETPYVGSGTELGNVMGILVQPDAQPAAGVEVMLYPLERSFFVEGARRLYDTTDAQGAFSFEAGGWGYRLIAFDGQGNGATLDSLFPSLDTTMDLAEVPLQPVGGLRAFVIRNSTAMDRVNLELLGTPWDTTFGGGEIVWDGLPAGTYWLDVFQIAGATMGGSLRLPVTILPGVITNLSDTVDFSVDVITLNPQQLPYRFSYGMRPAFGGETPDSVLWVINGSDSTRLSFDVSSKFYHYILDSENLGVGDTTVIQVYLSGQAGYDWVHTWLITLESAPGSPLAYQAVHAVLLDVEPDTRPGAGVAGPGGRNPQLGTFQVLEKRLLAEEELVYWGWPAAAGGDSIVAEEFQAAISGVTPFLHRVCNDNGFRESLEPSYLPGDTVTFYLLPDSVLGARAFRVEAGDPFEYMDRMGWFARADWPAAQSLAAMKRPFEMQVAVREDGFHLYWGWLMLFKDTLQGSQECQSAYRHFRIDSAGQVRESVAVPPGLDSASLLLHYRGGFSGLDADSLPASGSFVFIDSSGAGVAGTDDTLWNFALGAEDLAELKSLLEALPQTIPEDWHQEVYNTVWYDGVKEGTRFLLADGRGALYVPLNLQSDTAKVTLFNQVEAWLVGQGLF